MEVVFRFLGGTTILIIGLFGFLLGMTLLVIPRSSVTTIVGLTKFAGGASGGSGMKKLNDFLSWLANSWARKLVFSLVVTVLGFGIMFCGSYLATR